MEIPLPPGYASAAPFDKSKHRRLGIRRTAASFARKLNAIYLTTAEFPRACHDYPIAFSRGAHRELMPIVITGVENDTNLFVDAKGYWLKGVYCPAYVRRFPFFTVTVAGADPESGLICVDEHELDAASPNLLDASGEPTDRWREIELLITEMDRAQRTTAALCGRIDELDLAEAFEADFHPRGKNEVRLSGLYRVNEQRLLKLSDAEQLSLLREGHLARIYAHLLSLENMNRLLDRSANSGSK
jgi:hypothetical protein